MNPLSVSILARRPPVCAWRRTGGSPQTLKQREDAGVGECWGMPPIEVTVRPGDFLRRRRAPSSGGPWKPIRGPDRPRHAGRRQYFENIRRAIHKRAVRSMLTKNGREGNAEAVKNSLCPPEKPQASPYEGVYGKRANYTAVRCRRLTYAALRRFPLSLAHGLLVKRVG